MIDENIESQPSKVMVIFAFVAIYLIWGSTYFFNKVVIQEIPPYASAGIRFVIASFIIFLGAKLMKVPFDINFEKFKNSSILGVLFLTLGNGGVVWALQFVDSGFAALLISAQPLVLILLMWILERRSIAPRTLFGVALGMLGIYLLTSDTEIVHNGDYYIGVAVIFFCLICWGYGSIYASKAKVPTNQFVNSGVQMIVGGLLMVVISFAIGEDWSKMDQVSNRVWWGLVYLIIFGSIIAYTSFNFLLKYISPEKVSTNTYVNPIVAMFLGWFFLAEPITNRAIIAACILLIGVFVINTRKTNKL
jgi:drug/metabolite transporter (DMT)-like permease